MSTPTATSSPTHRCVSIPGTPALSSQDLGIERSGPGADEPSGSLDSANRAELHKLFFDLRRDLGHTFVIVTHDETLARQTDRMVCMADGLITGIIDNRPSRAAKS